MIETLLTIKNSTNMTNSISITDSVQGIMNAKNEIVSLEQKIKSCVGVLIQQLESDFENEIQLVKNAISKCFTKVKYSPASFGWTVQSPMFKECTPSEIRNTINAELEKDGITIKIEVVSDYWTKPYEGRPKVVNVVLNKTWMRKARPEYKNAFDLI